MRFCTFLSIISFLFIFLKPFRKEIAICEKMLFAICGKNFVAIQLRLAYRWMYRIPPNTHQFTHHNLNYRRAVPHQNEIEAPPKAAEQPDWAMGNQAWHTNF